ncbi:hypothetical protein [Streptomyces bullii]|uniref:Uncharacterized protein n=1 Tax=Streptomyces bullii TaxID=349910 RepID=A0ABW0UVU8_9ACTN
MVPEAPEPSLPTTATPDGRRSLTSTATTQISESLRPELLRRARAVQENHVRALLRDRG